MSWLVVLRPVREEMPFVTAEIGPYRISVR
jgi:hypothetical protein